jgi:hypothetical protein
MTPPYPEATNRALAILLAGAHRTEGEMAAAAGLRPGTISSYVSGWKNLSMKTLLRISRDAGFAPAAVEDALDLAARLGPGHAEPAHKPDLPAAIGRIAERLAAERLSQLLQDAVPWEERRRFRELWAGKKGLAAKDWKAQRSTIHLFSLRNERLRDGDSTPELSFPSLAAPVILRASRASRKDLGGGTCRPPRSFGRQGSLRMTSLSA